MEVLSFKKANCKDCYKCVRECPIKAIRVKDRQAQIIAEECILCGRCVKICPQNAKQVRDDVPLVKAMMQSGKKVVASLAPSYIAAFDTDGFAPIAEAIKKLGFFDVQETAAGANVVKREYERLVKEKQPVVISSCCHSVVSLIQKYYVGCIPYLAKVLSPMDAHGRLMKQQYPDAEVVFISPCISKKDEVDQYCKSGSISVTITFDELSDWFSEAGVTIDNACGDDSKFRSRFFPETGGIIKSMNLQSDYQYMAIDGVENCRHALEEMMAGKMNGYFIEMSACEGSCINGPGMPREKKGMITSRTMVEKVADQSKDYDVEHQLHLQKYIDMDLPHVDVPGETAITAILAKIGKTKPEDMLNCGACGYSTCREKAIAVYQKKAELEMCLPYMKERAESVSDQILDSSPNAIIALDSSFSIQQFNAAAYRLMKIDPNKKMVGVPIGEVYDEVELVNIIDSRQNILSEKCYLDRYGIYVEKSVIYDYDHGLLLIFLKDINKEENAAKHELEMRRDTVEITDRVINKQMRVAQEIASLLGETTAETKIALTKLKRSMVDDVSTGE
ncbi:MAG: [Fe-Fe] hydrogenase large subunit C-terminal domain-containing protein [Oscillospiraceae bacterium]